MYLLFLKIRLNGLELLHDVLILLSFFMCLLKLDVLVAFACHEVVVFCCLTLGDNHGLSLHQHLARHLSLYEQPSVVPHLFVDGSRSAHIRCTLDPRQRAGVVEEPL